MVTQFAAFTKSSEGWAETPVAVSGSFRVVTDITEEHRSQGDTGLCYGHSVRSALEQFLRRKKLVLRDDLLSVLDVIAKGNNGQIKNGGDAFQILTSLSAEEQTSVATEECVPISLHINSQGTTWTNESRQAFATAYASYPLGSFFDRNAIANRLRPFIPNYFSIEEIAVSLPQSGVFESFLGSLYRSRRCYSESQIRLPGFKIGLIPESATLNRGTILSTIKYNIQRNIPLIWNLCRAANGPGCSDGHSTLIIGYRETNFSDGSVKTDVLINDSLPTAGALSPSQNWVLEEHLLRFSMMEPKPQQIQNGVQIGYRTLLWLEER